MDNSTKVAILGAGVAGIAMVEALREFEDIIIMYSPEMDSRSYVDKALLVAELYIARHTYIPHTLMGRSRYFGDGRSFTFGTELPKSVQQIIGNLSYKFVSIVSTLVKTMVKHIFTESRSNLQGIHNLKIKQLWLRTSLA